MASTSITLDDRTKREVASEERPITIRPADLFKAAIQGDGNFLVRHLGLSTEQNYTEEENEDVHNKLKSATLFGDTVLHVLVANGHNGPALKVILKDASLLKAVNKKLETPLHCAVRAGNMAIIESLIQHAPEVVYQVNNEGLSPLHLAIAESQIEVAKSMLHIDSSLACAQFSNGMFPVHVAACMDITILLKHLLDTYPDSVELKDSQGRNFFHIAAEENKTKVFTEVFANDVTTMNMFLSEKMDVMIKSKDYNGNTPLHIAAMKGNKIIMRAIWEYLFVDATNQQNNEDLTSFHESWLRAGNQVYAANEQNNKGLTPFDLSEIQLKCTLGEGITQYIKTYIQYPGRQFTKYWFDGIMELSSDKNKWEKRQIIGLGAVLITTIAFAAAFTIPGGYNSDHGTPILGRRYMFRAFIIANALAFVQAFASVYDIVSKGAYDVLDDDELRLPTYMFLSASNCMVVAFGTGSYVMLAPISLPVAKFVLVLALLFGSPPKAYFIYGATGSILKTISHRTKDSPTLFSNWKFNLSSNMVLFGLPFVFIFCLAFLK